MGRNKSSKQIPTKPKLKKDPGVPRLPDLKQKKNVEKQRSASRTAQAYKRDQDTPMASEPTLSSLAALAESSGKDFEDAISGTSSSGEPYKVQLRRQYIRTLHKVIEESDIILLVLDARDPEGCRSRLVEEEVRRREAEGKKLVFVLNKVDLVPRANAEAWLRYLRHSTPTLPFRSSTQEQRQHLTSRTSPALLSLLKSLKRSTSSLGSITVGVVGYPNVGKSSLINSLRRARVCAVAAEAGHTKEMQSVQVERGIRVLDSPGVVFDDDEAERNNILLRNVVKVEDIADPIAVVDQILTRTPPTLLQSIYSLPAFNSPLEFLTMLALSSGKLHKGGTPDILAAARFVIQDWNSQKIPYHTEPPNLSEHPSNVPDTMSATDAAKYGFNTGNGDQDMIAPGAEDVGQASIVKEMAPAFDLGGLFSRADAGAFEGGDAEMEDAEKPQVITEDVIEMESDEPISALSRKRRRSVSPTSPSFISALQPETPPSKRLRHSQLAEAPSVNETASLASHNPLNRRALKKDAKRARKTARRAGTKTEAGMEIDEEASSLAFTFMASPEGVVDS